MVARMDRDRLDAFTRDLWRRLGERELGPLKEAILPSSRSVVAVAMTITQRVCSSEPWPPTACCQRRAERPPA
jgi:hypothetical protein